MQPDKKSWKEIVAESRGTLIFCPDALQDKFKEWMEKRKILQSENERISKLAIESSVALENLVLDMRYYLENTGTKNVWQKDIGIETTASDQEGLNIFTVTEKRG